MLDRIPLEILDRILLLCDPIDLAHLSTLCHLFHQRIRHNNNLWQTIFLNHFDDPSETQPAIRSAFENHPTTPKGLTNPNQIDWRSTLIARITLSQTLALNDQCLLTQQLIKRYSAPKPPQLYQLIFLILYTARFPLVSLSSPYTNPSQSSQFHSLNLRFLSGLLSNPVAQLHLFHLPAVQGEEPPDSSRAYRDITDIEKPINNYPAKLHTLYGLTAVDLSYPRSRGLAREGSYLLLNYTRDNLYGPFIPFQSTRVNWFHLQDLSLVMGLNLHCIRLSYQSSPNASTQNVHFNLPNLPLDPPPFAMPEQLNIPLPHIQTNQDNTDNDPNYQQAHDRPPEQIDWPILNSLQSAVPFTQITHTSYLHPPLTWPPDPNLDLPIDLNHYDWAGVTGKWLRVVCFLDYRDFHAYNTRTKRFNNCIESVRTMTLDLEVVSIRDPPNSSHLMPLDVRTDLPHRPPIFFEGTLMYNVGVSSTPIIGQWVATLRGCVSMTIDDEVRWSMVSTLRGEDRWASEGIQVGGVQSKWGVLGVWTDANRNAIEAPVGPFYFFKTSCIS